MHCMHVVLGARWLMAAVVRYNVGSDGYGNASVHRLASDGRHIQSWGSPGTEPGQFALPHSIAIHPALERLLVCDQENNR